MRPAPRRRSGPKIRLKADAVERALASRNMTKKEFARLAGLHRTHLSDLLAGRCRPGPYTRERILAVLGGSFEEWFEIIG
jgi:transcriptional regulator with XRE-family HTH domain